MRIKINGDKANRLEKICNELKMNPSQLIELLLEIMQYLYSDYARQKEAGIEKEPFKEILAKLFLHSFKSKLQTLDIAEKLIESTNELLGIKEYAGAIIHNINPDFDNRSISYSIGYEFCLDAANMFVYKALVVEVELNQDYLEVAHVVYLPTFESMDINDKRINDTSNRIQEFFKAVYHEEFSPYANIEVNLLPIRDFPYSPSEPIHYIAIKLIVKADKAENIPSIEKISPIAGKVHSIVI